MKTATVRDLRTRFPVVQGWLEEGQPIAITKAGKRIAMLTQAEPLPQNSLATAFARRFGQSVIPSGEKTDMAGMLIDDRGP